MTASAPAAMALVTSPENLMPPSEISGTPEPRVARAHSAMAVICGTPAPLTTRVVQMEPGPMPTLMPSAPRFDQIARAFERGDVAGDQVHIRKASA